MNTDTATYFQVTLPNGCLVTKRAGKRDYRWAVCGTDEVLGWHMERTRAAADYSRRLGALPRDEWDTLSIERVRLA